MTNGTLTTKDGSNTLKVTLVETQTIRYGTRYWRVVIIGDDGSPVYFRKECWDFTPDVPTLREQVEELPLGARFTRPDGHHIWTKISDNLVAYYDPENPTDLWPTGIVTISSLDLNKYLNTNLITVLS